jgi:branched-chain amino acid transport system permease protein
MLGGIANPLGPIVGAVILTLLPEVPRVVRDWRRTVLGTILMIIAVWRPDRLLQRVRLRRS